MNSVAGSMMKDLLMQDVDLFLSTLVHFTGVNMIISVVTPLMTYLMVFTIFLSAHVACRTICR